MFKTVYNDMLHNNSEILKIVNNDMLQLQWTWPDFKVRSVSRKTKLLVIFFK